MAEQTNFYAVQRGAPRFKPISDGVINLHLDINIHTAGFVQAMEFWKNYGIFKRKFHIWKNYGI